MICPRSDEIPKEKCPTAISDFTLLQEHRDLNVNFEIHNHFIADIKSVKALETKVSSLIHFTIFKNFGLFTLWQCLKSKHIN